MIQELTNEERTILLDSLSEQRRKEHNEAIAFFAGEVGKLSNSLELFNLSQKYFDELLRTSVKVCDLDKVLALYEEEDLTQELRIDRIYFESEADKINSILNFIIEKGCDFPDITKYSKDVTIEQQQEEIVRVTKNSDAVSATMINELLDTVESLTKTFPKYQEYLKLYLNFTFNLSFLVNDLKVNVESGKILEALKIRKELELVKYLLSPYHLFISHALNIIKPSASKKEDTRVEAINCIFASAEECDSSTLNEHRNNINKLLGDALQKTTIKGVSISIETISAHINANNEIYTSEVKDNFLVFDLIKK